MSQETELLEAIRKGDAAAVAALLDADPALLRASAGPTSAILLAVYHGRADIARLFTDRGAELTFGEAIALGESDRVRATLDGDPSLLHAFTPDGFPPVGFAIFFRHPDLARELIERGADVSAAARNDQRVAPVHAAAAVCDAVSMRLLLERGADPNARQQVGFTALHGAANSGDRATAELLLAHGADPHPKNDEGKTPADVAAERGHTEFAEWLRQQPDHRQADHPKT
jgi:ankyrin repeat protein